MTQLVTAVKAQVQTGGLIIRFWDNTRRLGKDSLTPAVLETRLNLLDEYWAKYLNGHLSISTLDGFETCAYATEDQFTQTEDVYIATKTHLKTTLSKLQSVPTVAAGTSVPTSAALNAHHQLPRLSLPKFSGNRLEWECFRDMFDAMVHSVAEIPPVLKLQYLKASLGGEPAQLLRNIPISGDSYTGAWQLLIKRYDNKRILLDTYIKNLLDSPPAVKESPAELKRLIDTTEESIRALTSLGRPVNHWDDWFVHLLSHKLDAHSRHDWETSLTADEVFPTYAALSTFMENRIRVLESTRPQPRIDKSPLPSGYSRKPHPNFSSSSLAVMTEKSKSTIPKNFPPCPSCSGAHFFGYCSTFTKTPAKERTDMARRLHVCINCLRAGHRTPDCPSEKRCKNCNGKHHTMLHVEPSSSCSQVTHDDKKESTLYKPQNAGPLLPQQSNITASVSQPEARTHAAQVGQTVLLATALVDLEADNGHRVTVRALIDQGSDTTFVTENVAQQLRLPRHTVHVPITGMGGTSAGVAKSRVNLSVLSRMSNTFRLPVQALVFSKLTNLLPSHQVQWKDWTHLRDLQLADPNFDQPARIDVLFGADIYGQILRPGLRFGPAGTPIAQQTSLGWILSGLVSDIEQSFQADRPSVTSLHCQQNRHLSDQLRQFWDLDEVPVASTLSPEELQCENHFEATHSRLPSGQFRVRLPLKDDPDSRLGDSRRIAVNCLLRGERRRNAQLTLQDTYKEFMTQYLELGHMVPVTSITPLDAGRRPYYMPHHAVSKAHDPPTKIRVVFNASQTTTTGVSLNDLMHPGPKLQAELWMVLTRWRTVRYAFTTDIVKMYRQIAVHPQDSHLQRIVWRCDQDSDVKDYELTSVTYGTTSAPYLALRVLKQLAKEERSRWPRAASALEEATFVDDILSGADNPSEARQLQMDLIDLLQSGGFELSKWASNCSKLIGCRDFINSTAKTLPLPANQYVSTLGLQWDTQHDELRVKIMLGPPVSPCSKRSVLSEIAKLFDPLGWLAPVLIRGKILLQDLWLRGIDWDAPLSPDLLTSWEQFHAQIADLDRISVPRWVFTFRDSSISFHGFADASERAYAAAVFIRTTNSAGETRVSLLAARTKVAPIKTVSIPRLELCGAYLLSKLLPAVKATLHAEDAPTHAWTDSEVAFTWIRSHASRWKPFVANRVSAIQTNLPGVTWHHVQSAMNPADLATRGIDAAELSTSSLWWHGPTWLSQDKIAWPLSVKPNADMEENSELRKTATVFLSTCDFMTDVIERQSTLTKLIRVVAYCYRFIRNARCTPRPRSIGCLTPDELTRSSSLIVKHVQAQHYAEELTALRARNPLPRRSPLRGFNPFLDPSGLLRIGGRLDNAGLSYEEKHPKILPKTARFSLLVVQDAHMRTLHGGPQLTHSHVLREFWIMRGKCLIRNVIRLCVRCIRFKAKPLQQQMGPLPAVRLAESRPFLHTGLDYAGPVLIRTTKGRGNKAYKGYLSLFVCLVTRAIHIEVVSDYSSSTFIAAFKRFAARRGQPSSLYSDNGTTFKGADAQLQAMFQEASQLHRDVAEALANDRTSWTFIPPHAPHFGGLWEAGVKSIKHHLRRIVGDALLTFEEFTTLTAQIEAVLNSRPIHPLSSDPSDLSALTPGHFLIGCAPTAIPESVPLDLNTHRLSRWQLLTKINSHFWSRWSREYLHHLQQRSKWTTPVQNVQIGDLVILKDEIRPPTKWALARVIRLHPGQDDLVRVVDVRTATTELRRPIAKLCLLPVKHDTA